jgi:hypothetical protein
MPTKKTATKKVPVVAAVVPKKKVASKAAPKKVVTKKSTCGACKAACLPEQAFWVNNGPVVDSLMGLKQALNDMTDEQYAYHTARAGNDFASWVRDCLGDTVTAVRIAKTKTRDGAMRAIICTC